MTAPLIAVLAIGLVIARFFPAPVVGLALVLAVIVDWLTVKVELVAPRASEQKRPLP